MAGSSLAATTITSSVAGPCPRSSAWPHRRRIARPRWPRHQRTPLPGSGRGCARFACRARADRSATGHCSRRLGEAWRRATARSRAGRQKSRIRPWGGVGGPAVISKIEVDAASIFGDPDVHRPLRRIEEDFPCWSCCLWFHAGNRPGASPQGRASQTKMIEVAVTVAFRPPSQVQTRKKGRRC